MEYIAVPILLASPLKLPVIPLTISDKRLQYPVSGRKKINRSNNVRTLNMLKLVLVLSLSCFLIACGPSAEDVAKERARIDMEIQQLRDEIEKENLLIKKKTPDLKEAKQRREKYINKLRDEYGIDVGREVYLPELKAEACGLQIQIAQAQEKTEENLKMLQEEYDAVVSQLKSDFDFIYNPDECIIPKKNASIQLPTGF